MKGKSHLEEVRHFHDQDAAQYISNRYRTDSCEGLAYTTRKQIILDNISTHWERILDMGCGPGILTPDLIKNNRHVFNIDLSFEMIQLARENVGPGQDRLSSNYMVGDVCNVGMKDSQFDCILCIGVTYYVSDLTSLIKEIRRLIRPGGTTIIQVNKITLPSVYKKLIPVYQAAKRYLTGKKYDAITFSFNVFSYNMFIEELKSNDFEIDEVHFYDFRLPFIDLILPKLSLKLSAYMFKNRHRKMVNMVSNGVLVKAISTKS